MSGFVPKSGQPTKGGSLSESPRARKLLRYFFRHEPSVGSSGEHAANGAINLGLNETQPRVGGESEPRPNVGSSRNDAASLNHDCPASLQKIIVELVSSERAAGLNSEWRSDRQALPRPLGNGAVAPAIFSGAELAEPA